MTIYQASQIKRRRASKNEMEDRAAFLIAYALKHKPVTVRQLFYAATVAGIPGIEKSEAGYNKVQAQCLELRRAGRLPYHCIADATRYMRKPRTFDGWEAALQDTAKLYRKSLWADSDEEVEIWLEKSALAGVIYPVTSEYDVALMPTGGYTSETFAYGAVSNIQHTGKTLVIYALYDFDRSGRDAALSLQEKVERFGSEFDVPVRFNHLGLTYDQVIDLDLPTRPAKRNSAADRRWEYRFAAELDAIPPDTIRDMVRDAIEGHLPAHELHHLKRIELAERETLLRFIGRH
ncbi:hypothetical protein [Roseovarius atlanticus]|uniref:hypothetical protein n=1 Tax=Roseovarius atlanticus TaxID=1641875 RepID=UPI001C93B372|nr:hypothetical protein [Roseovarius atlanticus]MBY5987099.1 hypothetical protein [Roseovarius atlanticus]MBY6125739.1 hypothetical protein [Roseovarius atlanticus]MBY6149800.1 hypothetical protein [Roseovarius atlanticus]